MQAYHPADLMRCPTHFCIGQEAAPAALAQCLRPDDVLFSHHRNHGYFLAKGGRMRRLFAELHGRDTGSNRGLAGSQDISENQLKFYSGAIVSGTAAIATGAAFAATLRGSHEVVITVFGDGAMDQGIMWESFNMAALKQLPIVYLCENNRYSTYSPVSARHANPDFVSRVASFGLSAHALPASPPRHILSTLAQFIAAVRSSRRPVFVEVETYRFAPHVGPEPDDTVGYRAAGEIEAWQAKDPLPRLQDELVPALISSDALKQMEQEIAQEIAEAFAFAQQSPFPQPELMHTALYSCQQRRTLPDPETDGSASFNPGQADAKLAPY